MNKKNVYVLIFNNINICVAEPWLERLLQEFFAQSAAEKSEGLPVTPFMDPDKVSKPGSQVRFIGLVLLPLFEALGELLPELIDMIIQPVRFALDYYKCVKTNRNFSLILVRVIQF